GSARIVENLQGMAIARLTEIVTEYIRYSTTCIKRQTRHHKPYRTLQPVLEPPIHFHTITTALLS
ncbi:hypothetical protein V8F44DRAFT_449959, partial [Aspergillus fumigatus]